jgi:SAM-dependent methyltransferase
VNDSSTKKPASWEYHLAELAVARSAKDKRRSVPDIPAGCERVLDVGCGAGQTLLACELNGAKAFGIELVLEALQLGRTLSSEINFVCGGGEMLPYRADSFDLVLSRVALPYMNIPVAIAEMARVLRSGGHIWLTLHGLSMFSWRNALRNPRTAAFEAYRMLNTASLHFIGRQFQYPLRRTMTESYQTRVGISGALRRAGFEDIQVGMDRDQFRVTARKRR